MTARRYICLGRLLAELKRFDISRDRPTVCRNDLCRVIRHRAIAITDDVEEMTQWCSFQAETVEGCRRSISTLDDHSCAITHAGVARRAINVVALLATLEHLHRDWEGQTFTLFTVDKASVEVTVFM